MTFPADERTVDRMRTLPVTCAVVAMFGLTAAKCTPEQIEAVAADYRAKLEAGSESVGPSIEVDAQCDTMTVTVTGWPDGSFISVGLESQSGIVLVPVNGTATERWSVEDHTDMIDGYYWSVVGRTPDAGELPTVRVEDTVVC